MLKIWGRPNSIHTQRVLWTCAEAEVPYELILASATMGPDGHISGGGKPYGIVDTPSYRAMNPNGTVPTIDDDGYVLWESNVISRYLAQKYAPEALFGGSLELLCGANCDAYQSTVDMYRQYTAYQTESALTLPEFFRNFVRVKGAIIYQAA